MTKKVMIIAGIWAVGKSKYCNEYIENNPEYVLMGADNTFEEIEKHEYVILDYYFSADYNANKLKKYLNCPVYIFILFDNPIEILRRQIFKKEIPQSPLGIKSIINVYLEELRHLVYFPTCNFIDWGITSYTYPEFLLKMQSFLYPKNEILEKRLIEIKESTGYDYNYQKLELPFGHKLGKDNYSLNDESWIIIKNLVDWNNKSVIDIGCNHGYFLQEVWKHGAHPVGVDMHENAIYSACIFSFMQSMDIIFYKINADHTHYLPQKNFDIGICMNVFHHFKEQDKVLTYLATHCTNVIFEINSEDIKKIDKYFHIINNIISPKCNNTRLILKCIPKTEE